MADTLTRTIRRYAKAAADSIRLAHICEEEGDASYDGIYRWKCSLAAMHHYADADRFAAHAIGMASR